MRARTPHERLEHRMRGDIFDAPVDRLSRSAMA